MQIKFWWHIIISLSLSEKQTEINQQPKNQCFWLLFPIHNFKFWPLNMVQWKISKWFLGKALLFFFTDRLYLKTLFDYFSLML